MNTLPIFFQSFVINYILPLFNLSTVPLWPFIILSCFILLAVMMGLAGFVVYVERKVAADIQNRFGPNVVGPYGLLQFLADAIKLFSKEDIIPTSSDKLLFKTGPILVFIGVFLAFLVLPFSESFIVANLDIGVLYILAVSSFVSIGIIVAGWGSANKWALFGSIRSAAQTISFSVPLTLSVLTPIMINGSLSMLSFGDNQQGFGWYVFHNPFVVLSFFIYFISSIAEVNRTPFDIPEAESELTGGYHTEYSGIRFAFFFLAEYAQCFVVCAIATTLYLGSWNFPFIFNASFLIDPGLLRFSLQLMFFLTKTALLFYILLWVRWTLPRLRIDRLMSFCWIYLTPLAFVSLVGSMLWIWIFKNRSFMALFFG